MSREIQGEFFFFLLCVAVGVLILFGYDLLRAFRRAFPHGILWLSIEDFFYWSIVGILNFSVIFLKNSGVLRAFSLIAIFIGMLLYHKSASFLVLKITSSIFRQIRKIFDKMLCFLRFPFRFLVNKFKKSPRKVLKKRIKEVKMTILKK